MSRVTNNEVEFPLHSCIIRGKVESLTLLLQQGFESNVRHKDASLLALAEQIDNRERRIPIINILLQNHYGAFGEQLTYDAELDAGSGFCAGLSLLSENNTPLVPSNDLAGFEQALFSQEDVMVHIQSLEDANPQKAFLATLISTCRNNLFEKSSAITPYLRSSKSTAAVANTPPLSVTFFEFLSRQLASLSNSQLTFEALRAVIVNGTIEQRVQLASNFSDFNNAPEPSGITLNSPEATRYGQTLFFGHQSPRHHYNQQAALLSRYTRELVAGLEQLQNALESWERRARRVNQLVDNSCFRSTIFAMNLAFIIGAVVPATLYRSNHDWYQACPDHFDEPTYRCRDTDYNPVHDPDTTICWGDDYRCVPQDDLNHQNFVFYSYVALAVLVPIILGAVVVAGCRRLLGTYFEPCQLKDINAKQKELAHSIKENAAELLGREVDYDPELNELLTTLSNTTNETDVSEFIAQVGALKALFVERTIAHNTGATAAGLDVEIPDLGRSLTAALAEIVIDIDEDNLDSATEDTPLLHL